MLLVEYFGQLLNENIIALIVGPGSRQGKGRNRLGNFISWYCFPRTSVLGQEALHEGVEPWLESRVSSSSGQPGKRQRDFFYTKSPEICWCKILFNSRNIYKCSLGQFRIKIIDLISFYSSVGDMIQTYQALPTFSIPRTGRKSPSFALLSQILPWQLFLVLTLIPPSDPSQRRNSSPSQSSRSVKRYLQYSSLHLYIFILLSH